MSTPHPSMISWCLTIILTGLCTFLTTPTYSARMADDDRGRSRVGSLESFFAKPVPLTAVSTGAIRFRATSQWTSSNWMTMGCAFHSIPVTCIACFFLIGKRKGAGRNVMDLNIEFATEKAREDFIELFFSPMVEDGMLED